MSSIPASSYLISDPSFVPQCSSKVTPNQYNREILRQNLSITFYIKTGCEAMQNNVYNFIHSFHTQSVKADKEK